MRSPHRLLFLRQSLAFVGDGGFSMLMAEFATCVKYDLPMKVIVMKNNALGQIKWEQMMFLGDPESGCPSTSPRLPVPVAARVTIAPRRLAYLRSLASPSGETQHRRRDAVPPLAREAPSSRL